MVPALPLFDNEISALNSPAATNCAVRRERYVGRQRSRSRQPCTTPFIRVRGRVSRDDSLQVIPRLEGLVLSAATYAEPTRHVAPSLGSSCLLHRRDEQPSNASRPRGDRQGYAARFRPTHYSSTARNSQSKTLNCCQLCVTATSHAVIMPSGASLALPDCVMMTARN